MKPQGASIIFFNSKKQILLCLRDDKSDIPYPNMWDVLGGHMEMGETPEQCIVRELKEEIEYDLVDFVLFRVTEFPDRTEHTFYKEVDFDAEAMPLHEGQKLRWFAAQELIDMKLGWDNHVVVREFIKKFL